MEIKQIKITDLKVHTSNPRLVKDANFKNLCESIKNNPDYFQTRPILYNIENTIFAGNQRFKAAKEIGLKEVPAVLMDISEERQKEIMIRDNRQAGEWDFEILANEFELEDLKEWGFEDWELGVSNLDVNNFFSDEDNKNKEPEKITCPKCGEIFLK